MRGNFLIDSFKMHFTNLQVLKLVFISLIVLHKPVFGQYQTIFEDGFSDTLKYRDLSKINLWGKNSVPVSGFRIGQKADASGLIFKSLSQTDSARKYAGYQTISSLKASLAFDYSFPNLLRNTDSMKLEFDVLWDELTSGGNSGRLVVALLHSNPAQIPVGSLVDSFGAKAPFGRPAYSFRILNRIPQGTNNYASMQYGGGKDSLGEFEKFSAGPLAWWLPGFISGPGGISPESSVNYPLGPVNRWTNYTLASKSTWRHFTWKIFPEKLEVWIRASAMPEGNDTLTMRMVIPKPGPIQGMLSTLQTGHNLSNLPDSLPTMYHWFDHFNGIRFYLNGGNITHLANIKLKSSILPTLNTARNSRMETQIYPNPFQEVLNISQPYGPLDEIVISDGLGRILFSSKPNQPHFSMDTRLWKPGFYIVKSSKTEKVKCIFKN